MFNWCIIGTGNIAKTVAKEITKSGRHSIVGVFSRTKSKAEAFALKFGAKSYDSIKQAVIDSNCDAVYIATPHSAHYPIIKECLEYGKPILCEKSFTVNSEQAKEVIRLAHEKNVYLCEAMWSRFNPVIKQIKKWIINGEIGSVTKISASFSLSLKITKAFLSERVYNKMYAGGALLDLGVYPIAYTHNILGNPLDIQCRMEIADGIDIDDKIKLIYKDALANLSCSLKKFASFKAVIEGTEGIIISPMFYRPKKAKLKSKNRETVIFKSKAGYIHQFDGVAEDIKANKLENDFICHKDTYEIMKIMDKCRELNNFAYPQEIELV